MIYPRYQSKTRRRGLRQAIRNSLGPSSEGPPGLTSLVYCAGKLSELIDQTTHGRYKVVIIYPNGDEVPSDQLGRDCVEWRDD